jgi:hypothetical protein
VPAAARQQSFAVIAIAANAIALLLARIRHDAPPFVPPVVATSTPGKAAMPTPNVSAVTGRHIKK